METGSLWLTAVALIFAVLLMRARPHERSVYLNTLWLFLICIGGEALADFFGAPNIMAIFRVVAAIAFIRMLGFFFFRLALPAVRPALPRIVEDLAIVA